MRDMVRNSKAEPQASQLCCGAVQHSNNRGSVLYLYAASCYPLGPTSILLFHCSTSVPLTLWDRLKPAGYKSALQEKHPLHKMTATNSPTDSDGRSRRGRAPRGVSVHDTILPSVGISNRRRISVPEPSSGIWARPPIEYIRGSGAASHSVTMDMSHTQSSESGVPPVISHQRPQPHTDLLHGHQAAFPVLPPQQTSYHSPLQGPPMHARPEGVTDPSPASAPPVTQRGSIVDPQRTPSNAHPHMHIVHPPPFPPHHMGSPGQEENMHHLAYISTSMLTTLQPYAPVYRYQLPDHVPNPSHTFPPNASAPTAFIYPHPFVNTSSPPHSPSSLRHVMGGPSSSAHHPTPYATHGAHTPFGYTTNSYPPMYGSHFPPHYARPYGFPTGQERQGIWWYSPPGASAAPHSYEGTQPELQPWSTAGYPPAGQLEGEQPGQRNTVSLPSETQPTRRQNKNKQTSIGRTLNDAEKESPFPTSPQNARPMTTEVSQLGKNKHQERRSYHPNPPAQRSDWVMWAGNVPSDATHDELREFFNQPLPPLSPQSKTEPSMDKQQVYAGVSTVFLISRSNCAFINFESEAQLEAATERFNGLPIRLDDPRCPRLVCRVRRREDDLMAGVGAQRGSGMHIKWVKEQKAKVRREHADTVGSPNAIVRPSSPLSASSDDSAGDTVATRSNLSRSVSIASTNSDILTRYFPQRYFILKSLTQYDLDMSVQKNVWTTQRHNEEILDQAYRTSKDVFLIFSVNKSGEFYGYARVAGPVLQGMPLASATGSTAPPSSESSLSDMALSPDDTGAKRLEPLYILPPDEHRVVKQSPRSAPVGQPSFTAAEPRKPYDRLTNSMPNLSTDPPRVVVPVQASSAELSPDTPSHARENPRARRTRELAEHDSHELFEPGLDDGPKPGSEMLLEGRNTKDDGAEPVWGQPFRVEWIRTNALPFFRTRHLRNPWNHGREVKVSRDGTELEPGLGQQLLFEWDRPAVAADNSPGPSRTTERRRGPKATQHAP